MSTFNMADLEGVKAHTGTRVTPEAGDYVVMISRASVENGKVAGNMNAAMEYTILSDGPFNGAVVKEWLAIVNKSEQAQNIARSKLRAIQIVSKSQNVQSVDELVGKQIIIRINKEANQYIDNNGNQRTGYQNNVVNYMDLKRQDSDGKEVAPFVAVAQTQQNAQANGFSSVRNPGAQSSGSSQTYSGGGVDDEIPF